MTAGDIIDVPMPTSLPPRKPQKNTPGNGAGEPYLSDAGLGGTSLADRARQEFLARIDEEVTFEEITSEQQRIPKFFAV